jgi:prepilin peptidase CpaA
MRKKMFMHDPNANTAIMILLAHGTLFILAMSAAITDLKQNCIYNWQTYGAAALGLCLNFWGGGWQALLWSASGLVVGFALLFPFYLFGGFGAGDVKFLAAIGALEGAVFALWAMAYAALIGGVMAFTVMIWKGVFWKTIKRCFYLMHHPFLASKELEASPQIVLPYGLAIAVGCCWALLALQV